MKGILPFVVLSFAVLLVHRQDAQFQRPNDILLISLPHFQANAVFSVVCVFLAQMVAVSVETKMPVRSQPILLGPCASTVNCVPHRSAVASTTQVGLLRQRVFLGPYVLLVLYVTLMKGFLNSEQQQATQLNFLFGLSILPFKSLQSFRKCHIFNKTHICIRQIRFKCIE